MLTPWCEYYSYTVPLVDEKSGEVLEAQADWEKYRASKENKDHFKLCYTRILGENRYYDNGAIAKLHLVVHPDGSVNYYKGSTVVMNSRGRVTAGEFSSQGMKGEIYGTPNLVVNSGYMDIQNRVINVLAGKSRQAHNFGPYWKQEAGDYIVYPVYCTYHFGCSKGAPSDDAFHIRSDAYARYWWHEVYGNNQLGDVTVKAGGTLSIGNGKQSLVESSDGMTSGKLTIEPGGMLYSSDSLENSLKITGLPANTRLFPIESTKGDGVLGDYDWTVWTDGNSQGSEDHG